MELKQILCSAALVMLASMPISASAEFNPFGSLNDVIKGATQQLAPAPKSKETLAADQSTAQTPDQFGLGKASKRRVIYEGYSKNILPIKTLIRQGKLSQAIGQMEKAYPDQESYDLLTSLQFGSMNLDADNAIKAEKRFAFAENKLVAANDEGFVTGLFSGVGKTALSTITGNDELGDYEGVGFERVLILNYKSIAHMLEGDRKAYNVTLRAIDLQNVEKKKFDALLKEAKEEIKTQEKEQQEKGAEIGNVGFGGIVKDQYKGSNKKALTVPSAFVNPFGFYIAGIVLELDGYEDASVRDNARISFKKALELNPKSSVIKQAIKDLSKPAKRNKRLVNVIIGDGFAPEKKILKFDLSMGLALPTEIELPIYEPVSSKVHRVEVQTSSGKRWARLSEVADITALAMRFQKDAGALAQLRMMSTVIRNVIEGHVWNQATQQAGVFGSFVSSIKEQRDEMVHPDMRSWSMLPSRLLAARFYVPKSVSLIKIVSYNRKGKVLASKIVNIDKTSHNIVYARTLDQTIYTASSNKMWVGM